MSNWFQSSQVKCFLLAFVATPMLAMQANGSASQEARKLFGEYKRPKAVPYAEDNPYTTEKEILGKALFFDPRLSGSGMMSCATCHNPSLGWSDGLSKAVGHNHKQLGRKTPTILNLAWTDRMMWDGRAKNLEDQALGPLANPDEMNMDMGQLPEKLASIPGYQKMFEKAFPGEKITNELVAKAIAVYERGIVSEKSPFDKWIEGNEKAITDDAKSGFVLFNTKAKCAACHSGWRFTDDSFHDIGLNTNDLGRGKFLKIQSQQHAFKTPGLRNIASRAPYLHNGSEHSLEGVVELYNRGGDARRPSLSENIKPLELTDLEKKQIVEFMKSLSSKDKAVTFPELPR